MKKQVLSELLRSKLVVIVRGVPDEKLEKLFDALYKGGVRFVEITFDSTGNIPAENTAAIISSLKQSFAGKIHIGAGTVLTLEQARLAKNAGAEYIIAPSVDAEIIKYCAQNDMVSIPGAMTPTEIVAAYKAGADIVKLFPSDFLGLSYIKAVTAPLRHIPMMAFGGVTKDNITDYLAVVNGAGVGAAIVNRELVAADDFDGITKLAKEFTDRI